MSIASTLLVNIVLAILYVFIFYLVKKGCDKTSQDRLNDKELEKEKSGLLKGSEGSQSGVRFLEDD